METLNLNKILDRENKETIIKNILNDFEINKNNPSFKKGIYIFGDPGIGKTSFAIKILKDLDYDIVKYDAGDIRNTNIIEEITKHNMSDKNIMSLFNKKIRKIAIIMDEIDGMNNGDKGGINTLIKLIRPKKTKKQKLEEVSMNPIICIGNYKIDKKIKELIKVCNTIELNTPIIKQVDEIICTLLPRLDSIIKNNIINYVSGDLRKLNNICNLYKYKPELFVPELMGDILQLKSYNDDTKKFIHKLMNNNYSISQHNTVMNETDRTSIGLLWHENIIDSIEKIDKRESLPFYIKQLNNICFADYIDRITFQKQIWQFNEMSSLIKIFKNNKCFHEFQTQTQTQRKNKTNMLIPTPSEVRFTKVLTKYSTEYNNSLFIQKLCQKLIIDKKDLFGLFIYLKNNFTNSEIINLLENYDICKLDINRIYRYIEKYIKENASGTADKDYELDDEEISIENESEI